MSKENTELHHYSKEGKVEIVHIGKVLKIAWLYLMAYNGCRITSKNLMEGDELKYYQKNVDYIRGVIDHFELDWSWMTNDKNP